MNTTVAALADAGVRSAARTIANPSSDRVFFTSMSLAFLLIALIAFGPSYFFRQQFAAPPLSPLVHVHGATFTAWLVLLTVQNALIAGGRRDWHRRLGFASVALVVTMMIVGLMAARIFAARPDPGPFGISTQAFLIVPLFTLTIFGLLFGLALRYRKQGDIHKRLIMIATIDIMGAATSRLPGMGALGVQGALSVPAIFILALAIYDYASRGKVHPVTLWVGGAVAMTMPLRILIGETETWLAFARWLIA